MLKGKIVTVRPAQEEDLPALYQHSLDIDNRGDFYPRHISTLTELRKEFHETGFWGNDRGLLLLIDNQTGKVVGQIAVFPTLPFLDELEIGYITYVQSVRKKGAMTEALRLLTWYLFNTRKVNRIRLTIVTENAASRRVAEKAGYQREGTMRGCFFNNGRHYDMELYAILRSDLDGQPPPLHRPA